MEAKETASKHAKPSSGATPSDAGSTAKSSGNPTTVPTMPTESSTSTTMALSASKSALQTPITAPLPASGKAVNEAETTAKKTAETGEKTEDKATKNNFVASPGKNKTPAENDNKTNTGNDRATVDKPHSPLVPMNASTGAAPSEAATPATTATKTTAVVAPPMKPVSTPTPASTSKTKAEVLGENIAKIPPPATSTSKATTPAPSGSSNKSPPKTTSMPPPGPPQMDEQTILEEAIKKKRAPLTDKYGSFITASDTNLKEARIRLRTAIEQTKQLRVAFTERVYGKYRVCLKPPSSTEDILQRVMSDPDTSAAELQKEIRSLKDEKDIEKKEAQKLNTEMMAATSNGEPNPLAAMNAENAEQLMYISAGLSLILLPEHDVTGLDMSSYSDRSPINPETGQRVRSISAAAAAAGEVMLDRARKGAAMRAERMRRKVDDKAESDNNYSRLSSLSSIAAKTVVPPPKPVVPPPVQRAAPTTTTAKPAPKTTTTPPPQLPPSSATPVAAAVTPKPPPIVPAIPKAIKRAAPTPKTQAAAASSAPSSRALRARVQASMTTQSLLSLNPSAEEVRVDGKVSGATMALMERGSTHGQNTKANQQQRMRHPFPDSLGGRRRAAGVGAKPTSGTDAFLPPAYMSAGLPLLPTAKERRSKRPIAVLERKNAGSSRAKEAISKVLEQFVAPEDRSSGTPETAAPLKKRRITEISFLHGIQSFDSEMGQDTASDSLPRASPSSSRQSIDPIMAFNVLRAVGLVRKSGHDETGAGKNLFPSKLDTSMFEVAEKRSMGDEGGQSRRSLAIMRSLHNKFSSDKRSFTDSFLRETAGQKSKNDSPVHGQDTEKNGNVENVTGSIVYEQVPVATIRGGGEAIKDSSENSKSKGGQQQANGSKPSNSNDNRRDQPSQVPSHMNANANPGMVWDGSGQHSLVLLNPQLAAAHPTPLLQHAGGPGNMQRNQQMQGQLHTNAIQLAHHLRHATASMARMPPQGRHGGDLADYIGGLHPQPNTAYEWASLNAASAAGVGNPLAALGLNPHGAAMVNFSVQADRARALLAREHAAAAHRQRAVALFGAAANHAYPQNLPPQFAHMGGAAATAALLNTQNSLMGHAGMSQVNTAMHTQPSHIENLGHAQKKDSNNSSNFNQPEKKKSSAKKETDGNAKSNSLKVKAEAKENSSQAASKTRKEVEGVAEANRKRKHQEGRVIESTSKKLAVKMNTDANPKSQAPLSDNGAAVSSKEGGSKVGLDKGATPSDTARSIVNAPQETTQVNQLRTKSIQNSSESDLDPKSKHEPDNNARVSKKPQSSGESGQLPAASSKQEISEKRDNSNSTPADGMCFFVPPAPNGVTAEAASLVLTARSYVAIDPIIGNEEALRNSLPLVDYLIAVGTAVPIPKALVSAQLREKLNSPVFRGSVLCNVPPSSREVAVACILLWLWKHHENCFQKAFAKSGRIDVDPECKWLVHASVERSVQALTLEVKSTASREGAQLAASLVNLRNKGNSSQKTPQVVENERLQTAYIDLLVASIVSKSLMGSLSLNDEADGLLPQFHDLMKYLDEFRKSALHSKSQERALLAALISRKATMSLPFSHAYASAMVRAGEAMGHGELFEVIQNEEVSVSTMIPYDVFTDESGAWEDPCRPVEGFTQNLTGDDLMRRAHARAMIQKSLKKLQDRHNIKGGTPLAGPYIDPPSSETATGSDAGSKSNAGAPGNTTPRGWFKRRSSFSEPPVKPGTGSAAATSWSLYDPKHYSAPLVWTGDDVENSPYGRHNKDTRPRSVSLSQGILRQTGKTGRGKSSGRAASVASNDQSKDGDGDEIRRSTHEIKWGEVAGIFQRVQITVSAAQKEKEKDSHEAPPVVRGQTIFAPFVRQVDSIPGSTDDESDTEEDLRDDIVIGRHQVVLDRMKSNLSAALEARKKIMDRRKNRSDKGK